MAHEIRLYKYIGGWDGLTAEWLADELDKANGAPVALRVNSPGGDIFEAHAMRNIILRYTGEITAYVDAVAASAASYLILGANKVVMCDNARLMIHRAWGFCMGNCIETRRFADDLEMFDTDIADLYAAKTGKPTADMLALMDAETWMSAKKAVEDGFADEVSTDGGAEAKWTADEWKNLGTRRVPTALLVDAPEDDDFIDLADQPAEPVEEPVAEADGNAPTTMESAEPEPQGDSEAEQGSTDPYEKELLIAR